MFSGFIFYCNYGLDFFVCWKVLVCRGIVISFFGEGRDGFSFVRLWVVFFVSDMCVSIFSFFESFREGCKCLWFRGVFKDVGFGVF